MGIWMWSIVSHADIYIKEPHGVAAEKVCESVIRHALLKSAVSGADHRIHTTKKTVIRHADPDGLPSFAEESLVSAGFIPLRKL